VKRIDIFFMVSNGSALADARVPWRDAGSDSTALPGAPGFKGRFSSVNFASQPAAHPNISFVRPTFSKPADLVSTTTYSGEGGAPGNAGLSEVELPRRRLHGSQ